MRVQESVMINILFYVSYLVQNVNTSVNTVFGLVGLFFSLSHKPTHNTNAIQMSVLYEYRVWSDMRGEVMMSDIRDSHT